MRDGRLKQRRNRPQREFKPRLSVITVRLTHEEHAQLRELAWQRRVSLNRLCVERLLAIADAAPDASVE